ncbi:REDUCTASE putative-RELATED [Salix koriyanagi]|uniref:REDUCTASE putative-RELATED n=1 Tax=Salix koriyanagi TaxID=2511006 RepID=A0A9Q0QKU3_9ROSI|nr:REDUCTASE putative-RELATED [Salix koriyanagi]
MVLQVRRHPLRELELNSEGYVVHGTVRDPSDGKNAHLLKLENARENLKLFKTDLLDYEGLSAAITGCAGVFHVACPIPTDPASILNPKDKLLEEAVTGTRNVLNACSITKVKKVISVSSIAAVMLNPNWPKDQAMNEESWSDLEFCKANEQWYFLAKTIAEKEALEYGKTSSLKIVTICPSIIIGPLLQPTMNSSSLYLLSYLKDGETLDSGTRSFVDDLAEKLKAMYPHCYYPKSFAGGLPSMDMNSEKLQTLGWKYRSLEESLVDTVKNYEERGDLAV